MNTDFARWIQSIFFLVMFGEVFGSGRKPLLTFEALLALWGIGEYTVHALSLLCLASRPGMLLASLGLNNFSSDYTTNALHKPVHDLISPCGKRKEK